MPKRKKKDDVIAKATLRQVRVSPRKARLILDLIKGKQLGEARQILQFSPHKAGKITLKLLESAMANAKHTTSVDVDDLWVTGGYVNMGKTMRRFLPRAQGRATPIRKRAAHITVELGVR